MQLGRRTEWKSFGSRLSLQAEIQQRGELSAGTAKVGDPK
jgi:hypothetical protein